MNKKTFNNRQSTKFSDSDLETSLPTSSEKELKGSSLFRNSVILLFFVVLVILTKRYWITSFSTILINESLQNSASESEAIPSGNIQPVKTVIAKRVDSYQVSRTYTGEITAGRTSELGFMRSDRLVRIIVNEGDNIRVGTALAYLDTSSLQAQEKEILAKRSQAEAKLQEMLAGNRSETIAAAKASVKNFSEQLQLAEKKKSRRETLYVDGAISREQLDEAVFEVESIQARLEEVRSQLEELEVGTRPEQIQAQRALINELDASLEQIKIEQEQSILKAPFSGTIAARRVDEGTVVTPDQSILRLVENNVIEARIGIPASSVEQLPLNSYQEIQIGGKTYSARVSSILPELNSQTRTVTAVFSLNQSKEAKFLLGQIARLKLKETVTSSGYWLPNTALVRRGRGLWSCYVLGKSASDDTNIFYIEQKDVEILHSKTEQVFVDGTLENGDRVVINGTHRLVSEQLVRVLP